MFRVTFRSWTTDFWATKNTPQNPRRTTHTSTPPTQKQTERREKRNYTLKELKLGMEGVNSKVWMHSARFNEP